MPMVAQPCADSVLESVMGSYPMAQESAVLLTL
jgi:hypothetical protein